MKTFREAAICNFAGNFKQRDFDQDFI